MEPALSGLPRVQLLLASQSPARLATLRAAGIEPLVRVSGVDEEAVLAQAQREAPGPLAVSDAVLALAQAKAAAVVSAVTEQHQPLPWTAATAGALEAPGTRGGVLVACDSMLDLDGTALGKPQTTDLALDRWRAVRGRVATLHTGHVLVDLRGKAAGGTGRTLATTASTTVRFADLTDEEIAAYVATGEPLHVAGGFTVDGLGGAFVTSIEGDFHNVVGLSLPLLRTMLGEIGIAWPSLWATDTD